MYSVFDWAAWNCFCEALSSASAVVCCDPTPPPPSSSYISLISLMIGLTMEPSSYSHSSPAFPSLSWVVCCFLIPDSWVFIWFVAWWAGGGAAVARRGSKVDGNPNLITIQLPILCILWLDPTTSNPASCATLQFFRQFFSFHALEIRPPTLFHGHNCTIICHLFHWLVFFSRKCCQNLAESPLRAVRVVGRLEEQYNSS